MGEEREKQTKTTTKKAGEEKEVGKKRGGGGGRRKLQEKKRQEKRKREKRERKNKKRRRKNTQKDGFVVEQERQKNKTWIGVWPRTETRRIIRGGGCVSSSCGQLRHCVHNCSIIASLASCFVWTDFPFWLHSRGPGGLRCQ